MSITPPLNTYGDSFTPVGQHGIDVSLQRADDLDLLAIAEIRDRRTKNKSVIAVDLGCGKGGQALRMAEAGARVLAIDRLNTLAVSHPALVFRSVDLAQPLPLRIKDSLDIIVMQRTIHYFTPEQAFSLLRSLHTLLAPDVALYISASGLHSELGQDYPASTQPWSTRWSELAPEMAQKHNILAPVCLYKESDLSTLLVTTGFSLVQLYSSAFGNIKAIACKI